jgi:hypothetical protein
MICASAESGVISIMQTGSSAMVASSSRWTRLLEARCVPAKIAWKIGGFQESDGPMAGKNSMTTV